MFEQKARGKYPIRLVLNGKSASALEFHMRHYTGRGLMRKMSGPELAAAIGCSEDKLDRSFADYNMIAQGVIARDPFGKKYFPNTPFSVDATFNVAVMEPVLHFTMGGIEIDQHAQVLNAEQKPFHGLYACGELAGGVHGANRLGGSSLLGCVVYGRVAGDSSTKFLMQQMIRDSKKEGQAHRDGVDIAGARLRQLSLHIDPNDPCRISVEWGPGSGSGSDTNPSSSNPTTTPPATDTSSKASKASETSETSETSADDAPPAPPAKTKKPFTIPSRSYTLDEISTHNTPSSLWIAVKGVVLDLTHWVDEHPGGAPALYAQMGRDATEEFAMMHDDEVIPKYAPHLVVGKVEGQEVTLEY